MMNVELLSNQQNLVMYWPVQEVAKQQHYLQNFIFSPKKCHSPMVVGSVF